MNASALQSVKLRRTSGPRPTLDATAPLLCADSDQYRALMEETYLEAYYDDIREHSDARLRGCKRLHRVLFSRSAAGTLAQAYTG